MQWRLFSVWASIVRVYEQNITITSGIGSYDLHSLEKFKIGTFITQKFMVVFKNWKKWPLHRDWSPKFATVLNMIIVSSSKSIWVTRLLFCQNNSPMRGSYWEKDSLNFLKLQVFLRFTLLIWRPKRKTAEAKKKRVNQGYLVVQGLLALWEFHYCGFSKLLIKFG